MANVQLPFAPSLFLQDATTVSKVSIRIVALALQLYLTRFCFGAATIPVLNQRPNRNLIQ